MSEGEIVLPRGREPRPPTPSPQPAVQPSSPPSTGDSTAPARSPSVTSLALWLGCAGAVLLAGGTWFASRTLLQLGPAVVTALVIVLIGGGLVLAAAVLSVTAPAFLDADARAIAASLEAAARGDLSRVPDPPRGGGSLAVVSVALRRAVANLRSSLGPARAAAREAAQRAEELGTQCSVAHVAAQRSAELGANVAEQASVAADRAREAHGELSALARDVGQLEALLSGAVDTTARVATYTGSASANLADATRAVEELTARFSVASEELSGLGRSVEDVQEFVALVRKMARQSKLLSLNAAMEAARAGEQGTGFGVVAAEVRRLAKSSSEAADRTEHLLQDLLTRAAFAQESARETLLLAKSTRESIERSRAGVASLQQGLEQVAPPRHEAEAALAPGAALAALTARLDQLVAGLAALVQSARDTRLAGGAQVARVQDLIAASHSLSRSAARAASALHDLRLDPSAAVEPAQPPAPQPGAPAVPTTA